MGGVADSAKKRYPTCANTCLRGIRPKKKKSFLCTKLYVKKAQGSL